MNTYVIQHVYHKKGKVFCSMCLREAETETYSYNHGRESEDVYKCSCEDAKIIHGYNQSLNAVNYQRKKIMDELAKYDSRFERIKRTMKAVDELPFDLSKEEWEFLTPFIE